MTDLADTEPIAPDDIAGSDAIDADDAAPTVPFVFGGRLRASWKGGAAIALVLAFAMLPVRGLYRATGASMEEGFMLVFPHLVWKGWVPNVDFLHLYGPGSLHVLALWYQLFGYTLEAERTFGLLQHLGIIFALYTLTRPWGRGLAVGAGWITALLIMTPIGLAALAWHGAVALALWAVVFAVRAAHTTAGPAATRRWAVVGVLAGLSLTFRPDIALAVGAAIAFAVWGQRRVGLKPLLIGTVAGLMPMWFHLVVAGPIDAIDGMVIDPVFRLRAGRELPRPPSWDSLGGALQVIAEGVPAWWPLPSLNAAQQLFFWFFAVVIIAIAVPAVAWRLRRRGDTSPQTFVLLAAGLFGFGILPQALQRPDSTHLAWVAVVSWPLLAALIAHVGIARRPPPVSPSQVRAWQVAGVATIAVLMLVVAPFFTYRHYLLHIRVSAERLPLPFLVQRDERRFWFGDYYASRALNQAVADLDLLSEPGDRLIVGPADLSRAIYSDVAVYYLFPELVPATYYIEMDPGLADAEGSRLADDIKTADWLVLTHLWTGWEEPNASNEHGSQAANQAVADHFCLVERYEDNLVLLFQRCEGGGGVSPADILGRYPE